MPTTTRRVVGPPSGAVTVGQLEPGDWFWHNDDLVLKTDTEDDDGVLCVFSNGVLAPFQYDAVVAAVLHVTIDTTPPPF